jgi:hypothetical protein
MCLGTTIRDLLMLTDVSSTLTLRNPANLSHDASLPFDLGKFPHVTLHNTPYQTNLSSLGGGHRIP